MVVLPNIRRKYMVGRIPKGATVPMPSCVVTLAADSATYTGSARTVGVTVTWEGATLAVNTDYTLAYSNNVNLGPATVTVTGMGQFAGSVTKTFYIVQAHSAVDWKFILDDFPDIIDFSQFSNSSHGYYFVPCPSRDETKLLISYSLNRNVARLNWSNFDPSTVDWGTTPNFANIPAVTAFCTPDGLHYLCADGEVTVKMHVGTSAYDVTTISSSASSTFRSTDGYVRGGFLSPDGEHMLLSTSQNVLLSADLTTAFDLSTATNVKQASIGFNGRMFANGNTGTQLLIVSGASGTDSIVMVSLGSQWDASSVVGVDSIKPDVKIGSDTYTSSVFLKGIAVNNAGNKVLLIGSAVDMSSPTPPSNMAFAAMLDFSS